MAQGQVLEGEPAVAAEEGEDREQVEGGWSRAAIVAADGRQINYYRADDVLAKDRTCVTPLLTPKVFQWEAFAISSSAGLPQQRSRLPGGSRKGQLGVESDVALTRQERGRRMEATDRLDVHCFLRASEAEIETGAFENAGGKLAELSRPYEPADEERDKYAHAAFEPLTVLVAAYAIAFLAERLSRLAQDQSHAGLMVDLRTTPAKI